MKLAAFLIVLTLLRLAVIGHVELSPDEAYYHEWSQRLDWCYFSKGPGVAVAMRVSTAIFGHSEFGVRFFAPILALGTSLILYWLARRMYEDRVAFWAVVVMNLTPLFNAGGLVMSIDPLSIFFWTAALATLWLALEQGSGDEPRFSLWWPASGLLIGLGFLCKWTNAFQLLSVLLLLLLTPRYRKELRRPGFYVMLLAFLPALYPVCVWQSARGWPLLAHLSARGGLETPWWRFDTKDFGAFVGLHLVVYSPLLFLGMVIALGTETRESFQRWWKAVLLCVPSIPGGLKRHWGATLFVLLLALAFYFAGNFWDEYSFLHKGAIVTLVFGALVGIAQCKDAANVHWRSRFIAAFALPIIFVYLWIALHHDSEVNWTAPGFVGLFILVTAYYIDRVSRRLLAWTCGTAVALSLVGGITDLARMIGIPWPSKWDQTTRVRGWAESARAVDRFRGEMEKELKRPIFLIGENYGVAAELCYYLPPRPPEALGHPACYVLESVVPENQFHFWPRYDDYVERQMPKNLLNDQEDSLEIGTCPFAGRTAIYVTTREEKKCPDIINSTFGSWQIMRDVEIKENGRVLRKLRFFIFHRYNPGAIMN